MSISNRILHKSMFISFQKDTKNSQIIDYGVLNKTEKNESNRNFTQKLSIKDKIFSLFKTHTKISFQKETDTVDSNDRPILNSDSNKNEDSASFSTLSSNKRQFPSIAQSRIISERRDRIEVLDRELSDQLPLHFLTQSIIDCVSDQPCTLIKLPSSLITDIGPSFSNKALQPFLISIPGLIGLKNHGNTCYINVIVQCLAHLDSVAEYLSTKDYLGDIVDLMKQKPVPTSSNKHSTSGIDVLVALSYLIQSLWQQSYTPKISIKFSQILSLQNRLFGVDSQHDAQELLLYILNLLHDNLVNPGSDYEEKSSFIYDRFRGWLSNELTCPQCLHGSKFNDQMLSLYLPISKVNCDINKSWNNTIFCIIIINGNELPEKHAFEINKTTSVAGLRAIIAERLDCVSSEIIVLELVRSGFGKMYYDVELIGNIFQKNNYLSFNTYDYFESGLYAVHIPTQVLEIDELQSDDELFIRLLVVHVEKSKDYIIEIDEDLKQTSFIDPYNKTSTTLNQRYFIRFTNVLIIQAACKTKLVLLRYSLCEQLCNHLNLKNVTKLPTPQLLIEGSHLISESNTYPLCEPSVIMALNQSAEVYGDESAIVRLLVVWPFKITRILKLNRKVLLESGQYSQFHSQSFQKILLHHSVEELSLKANNMSTKNAYNQSISVPEITLMECLREYFGLDSQFVTELWSCPTCQTTQQTHTKIRIKQAPEILILMFKRFTKSQTCNVDYKKVSKNNSMKNHIFHNQKKGNIWKTNTSKNNDSKTSDDYLNKLECFIDYPLENLDMKDYMENTLENEIYLYNLVAVVNHRGNLSNGHYFAMCQNSIDNEWRLYDDDRVTEILRSNVVHPDAYILFYKRKLVSPDLDSNFNLHWSYRRLSFPNKLHRNQTPNPTSLYSTNRRYSERDPKPRSRTSYETSLFKTLNNQNSFYSLKPHLNLINTNTLVRKVILSQPLSSLSNKTVSKISSIPSHLKRSILCPFSSLSLSCLDDFFSSLSTSSLNVSMRLSHKTTDLNAIRECSLKTSSNPCNKSVNFKK